jgi:hypothetical protein
MLNANLQLRNLLLVDLTGSANPAQALPQDFATIINCAAALPTGINYVVCSEESATQPEEIVTLIAGQVIAQWSCPQTGYGSVQLAYAPIAVHGGAQLAAGKPMLVCQLAGSPLCSAQTLYVLPMQG